MKKFTYSFEISDAAYKLLLSIEKEGAAEYRDTRWESLQDFRDDETKNNFQTESYYLNRNHNGTYYLIGELSEYNLVEHAEDSWHITYVLTSFAKDLLSLQNQRDEKIKEILQ